jgi:hypothetical protein
MPVVQPPPVIGKLPVVVVPPRLVAPELARKLAMVELVVFPQSAEPQLHMPAAVVVLVTIKRLAMELVAQVAVALEPTSLRLMPRQTLVAAAVVPAVTGPMIPMAETVALVLSYCLGDPYWR